MIRKMLIILALFLFTVILSIVLTLIAMNIGGNYFTDFEFLGGRGYEATGSLGTIGGIVLGLILSILVYINLRKRHII